MTDRTAIEWTDATWNPVTGCTKVSPGCDHCYAESIAHRFAGTKAYPHGFEVTLRPERLDQPLRWRRPRRVFVNSMSDLFHADIPDEYVAQVFAVMAIARQHIFQVLTKRPARMRSLLSSATFWHEVARQGRVHFIGCQEDWLAAGAMLGGTPLPNVWLGISAEDQKWAEVRIPALLDTPAAVRFVSAEPLLGPIDLFARSSIDRDPGLDWVIVGGESGPHARPMHPNWARSLRDQCVDAGVPFFFKQHGEWTEDVWIDADGDRHLNVPPDGNRDRRLCAMHPAGMTAMRPDNKFNPFRAGHPHWTAMRRVGKKAAGRELDGRTWDEYPAESAVR